VLSDRDIRNELAQGGLVITPLGDNALQPASVDLHLGEDFLVFKVADMTAIDPEVDQSDMMTKVHVPAGRPVVGYPGGQRPRFVLHPNEFVLACTMERVTLPPHLVGRLEGKSSLGRLGLLTHSTAGFFDPGFDGVPTLELSSCAPIPIILWPGMKVCQMSFDRTESVAERPYGHPDLKSKYQGQGNVTASRSDRPPLPQLCMAVDPSLKAMREAFIAHDERVPPDVMWATEAGCTLPRDHPTGWHSSVDNSGKVVAEWRGPR
jgi:dCTP deaminase